MHFPQTFLAATLFATMGLTSAATVDVTTGPAGAHSDAGRSTWAQRASADELARYLKRLANDLLAPDATLRVELLDIDLAGTQLGGGKRVVTGGADWPRIRLRYTLEQPGQAPRSGEELVQDMNYTRGLTGTRSEPLHYEKRMLRTWFRERFAPA